MKMTLDCKNTQILTFHVWHHLNTSCKYTIMQKLTFSMWRRRRSSCFFFTAESTQQPNNNIYIYIFFLHVLQSIQKWIYVHTDDLICTVFEMDKTSGLFTKTLLVRVNINFMYVCFHVLQVEYKDPVMKCCMPFIICGIHTMQH